MTIKKRMNTLYRQSFIMLFLIIIFLDFNRITVVAKDQEVKNILILNSYQSGLSWSDHELDGIMEALNNSDLKYSIAVEYMDWKNYPTKKNLEAIYACLYYKYAEKVLDIVITTDDAALEFALDNRKELFSDTPIVFCGVNETGVQKLTAGEVDVTGVVETVDADKTIEAALAMNPELKEIYVIYDNTESGISTGELTIGEIHKLAPEVKVIALNKGTYTEILKQVDQVPKDSIILITTYYVDDKGCIVGFEDFSEMISNESQVPVFHLYEFGMDHGAIGGSMLSGRLQGESAGGIAVKVLQGVPISDIPIVREKTTRYIFDYNELERFQIPLERVPKDSQILNEPFSFIETYKDLVITTAIIFSLLVTFIFVLALYLRKVSRMKKILYESNLELSNLYEDLTASDEELKQQFDELTQTQMNLMASEERYAQLFESMLNGFFVFEPILDQEKHLKDLRFSTVNPSFERYINMTADRIIGRTWIEVFSEPITELERIEKVIITGEAERFETYNNVNQTYYLVNAFRIKNNQVGVVIDNITDYKKAIEEVGKLNEELELRVIERTNDLQSAIKELEAFTYTVSHDLKSPLRAVDGYSKIILEDYEEKMEEEAVSMLSCIRSICNEMIDMINKLLQYSTTSRMALNMEQIDCNEMFTAVFQEMKSTLSDRRIELRIETGLPTVKADRILLKQVVTNIISNAIKFTKEKEVAIIKVGATLTEDEYMFYIKDNGVGFDMNYSGKLFSIFQRLHTSDEFEGSGIGLVTIKKIIEKHGGRTWIEGEVNVGATVYFTLPINWDPNTN